MSHHSPMPKDLLQLSESTNNMNNKNIRVLEYKDQLEQKLRLLLLLLYSNSNFYILISCHTTSNYRYILRCYFMVLGF
jgi:hypothetical protein